MAGGHLYAKERIEKLQHGTAVRCVGESHHEEDKLRMPLGTGDRIKAECNEMTTCFN